jgi:hypothetical protein
MLFGIRQEWRPSDISMNILEFCRFKHQVIPIPSVVSMSVDVLAPINRFKWDG